MKPAIILFCLLPALPAWPQTAGQSQPEVTSHEGAVTFSSRVNLVSVPVVVRDSEGRAVGNLKQEDFQLFDKGKLQTITAFSIERSGKTESPAVETSAPGSNRQAQTKPIPARPALPERYIAYLVDDIHLQRGDLLQTRRAVNRHLDEALEPGSRAAIFITSGRMMADFTDDREKLHKAVDSILPWTSGPDPQQDCPSITYYQADYLANKTQYFSGFLFTDLQILGFASSDQLLSAVLDQAAGCSGASSPPSSPPDPTGQTLPPDVPLIRLVRIAVHQALEYGNRDTSFSLGAVKDIVRRMSTVPGSRTIVLVSPGFILTQDFRSAEYDVLDRAVRANITVNTIDMRGLYAMPGFDASQPGSSSQFGGTLTQAAISEASQADDVLGELADGTGGTFFHNDNGLKEGLNLLAARPEYIYVLGFSPQNLKYDGSYHTLKVKVGNLRNATLQVRRGYWAPNHAVDPAEEARDEIREAVFSRDEIQDIPVDVQTEFFRLTDEKTELTVTGPCAASSGALEQLIQRWAVIPPGRRSGEEVGRAVTNADAASRYLDLQVVKVKRRSVLFLLRGIETERVGEFAVVHGRSDQIFDSVVVAEHQASRQACQHVHGVEAEFRHEKRETGSNPDQTLPARRACQVAGDRFQYMLEIHRALDERDSCVTSCTARSEPSLPNV
jgi:VWFA-related protein